MIRKVNLTFTRNDDFVAFLTINFGKYKLLIFRNIKFHSNFYSLYIFLSNFDSKNNNNTFPWLYQFTYQLYQYLRYKNSHLKYFSIYSKRIPFGFLYFSALTLQYLFVKYSSGIFKYSWQSFLNFYFRPAPSRVERFNRLHYPEYLAQLSLSLSLSRLYDATQFFVNPFTVIKIKLFPTSRLSSCCTAREREGEGGERGVSSSANAIWRWLSKHILWLEAKGYHGQRIVESPRCDTGTMPESTKVPEWIQIGNTPPERKMILEGLMRFIRAWSGI